VATTRTTTNTAEAAETALATVDPMLEQVSPMLATRVVCLVVMLRDKVVRKLDSLLTASDCCPILVLVAFVIEVLLLVDNLNDTKAAITNNLLHS